MTAKKKPQKPKMPRVGDCFWLQVSKTRWAILKYVGYYEKRESAQ